MKITKLISCLSGFRGTVAIKPDQSPTNKEWDHGRSLHLLASPPDAQIDIVAVHGLDGHWRNSWTAENGVFWLQDLLPSVLPNARIFSFGHDSRTRGADKPLTQDISDHGKDLVWLLSNERHLTNTETRPLIFIGHSLGGLVVKSALLTSHQAGVGHLERHKYIEISTGGVFYLATPHQGGQGVSLAQIVARVYSVFSHTNPKLLAQITPHSEWLQSLQSSYNSIGHHFDTTFFYETQEMAIPLLGSLLVVPKFSAVVPGARNAEEVSMPADHKTIAKYLGIDDPNFKAVSGRLLVLARDIQQLVRQSWVHWREHKQLDIRRHLIELQGVPFREDATTQTTQTAEALLNFRVGFVVNQIPNRNFVGRNALLARMGEILQENTSQVYKMRVMVLFGTGGVGKTQLALHFAHQSASAYDSVFWIDGASVETATGSISRCLESIKRHYESYGSSALGNPLLDMVSKAIRPGGTGDSSNGKNHAPNIMEDFRRLRRAFAAWLSLPGNTRWLIVIDNVDDLESFDFREILPTAQSGAVLVTSRRHDLSMMWESIEVPSMEEEEAIELLDKTSKLSLKPGMELWADAQRLVETLGYLPLAIVQAGSFIAVQRPRNPISTYLKMLEEHPAEVLNYRLARSAWTYRNDTVLTTWEISFSTLSAQMPKAALIFQLCAFLSRDGIYEELFFTGLPLTTEIEVHMAFNLLLSFSFLRPILQPHSSQSGISDVSSFTIHPLIHLWARVRLDPMEQESMAHEALRLLYRSPTSRYSDVKEVYSFYKQAMPCDIDEVFQFDILDIGPMHLMEALLQRVKSMVLEPVLSFYRKFRFHDPVSYFTPCEIFTALSTKFPVQFTAPNWVVCQTGRALGIRHPKTMYLVGNLASDVYYDGQLQYSLMVYKWLFVSRSTLLGMKDSATTGAMMGISRSLIRNTPEWGFKGKGLSRVCPTALYYAINAYEPRLRGLGEDSLHTRNALLALNEVRCACFHQISKFDLLPDDTSNSLTYSSRLKKPRETLDWIKKIKRILPPPQPLGSLERPETLAVDCETTLIDIKYYVRARASLLQLIIDPYFHTGCEENRFKELTTAVQDLWQKVPDPEQVSYDRWTCIRVCAAIALYRVYTMGRPEEQIAEAGVWLAKLLNDIPLEWYADGFCHSEPLSPDARWLSYDYLQSPLYWALRPFVAFSPDYMNAVVYISILLTIRARLLLERLGYRMILSGWGSGFCLVGVVMNLEHMLRLEDHRGCIATHPVIVAAAEEMIEILGDDQSEWCFYDLRRAHMCAAPAHTLHSHARRK